MGINQLTFGQVVHLYVHFDAKLRNQIAKDVSYYLHDNLKEKIVFEPKDLQNYLFNLIDIRNCVAHNNLLFNFKAKNNVKFIPQIHEPNGILKTSSRQDPFNCFIMMQALLEKRQFVLFNNTLRKRMRSLNSKIDSISINTILSSLGFPENWQEKPALNQPN